MSNGRRFLGDVSWFQVIGSALASVTAAFLASKLGVSGTLIGAAIVSFVITISSSLYTNTLKQSRTLLVRTDSGTVIERAVDEGEVAEALEEAREVGGNVVGAQFAEDEKPRLHWKTILTTTGVVLALSLAILSVYELTTGHPVGTNDSDGGISITQPFGGNSDNQPADEAPASTPPAPTATPTATPATVAPTPTVAPTTEPTPTEPTATNPTATPTAPTTLPPRTR